MGALFFAVAAYLGIVLGSVFAERITAPPDGPEPHKVPVAVLIAVSAVLGAFVATQAKMPSQIMLIAIVYVALAAIWVTDARRGVVPDVFSLGPLVIILAVSLWKHEMGAFLAVAIPFVPFAAAALLSKGRGMGWGDVKLVALGGAVLGFPISIFACIGACLTAALVSYARGRKRGIIAFAPYLATAIAIAIPIGLWH